MTGSIFYIYTILPDQSHSSQLMGPISKSSGGKSDTKLSEVVTVTTSSSSGRAGFGSSRRETAGPTSERLRGGEYFTLEIRLAPLRSSHSF